MKNNKDKYLTWGTAFAFTVNSVLFAVKLFIGLSVNSISIYSDGINNLFDSLSGGLALICLMLLSKDRTLSAGPLIRNCENLLSFIMSVIVGITGFAFAYSSLERLMYPTPLWYRKKYMYLLIVTAAVKLIMHFAFKALGKKSRSPVLRVMAFDSLLDFFITAVTVMSLAVSGRGSYSIDAFCGIGISLVLIVSAVKMIFSSAGRLTGYVSKEKRLHTQELLFEHCGEDNVVSLTFLSGGEKPEALAELSSRTEISETVLTQIENETGMTVHIIKRKENTEKLCEMKNEN
ncbi:MAG: cation diffusion facilitator family transporter [Clostridia bacterium]|nr:cation diffusion facilitator family transporter [Clostridia bacterium]